MTDADDGGTRGGIPATAVESDDVIVKLLTVAMLLSLAVAVLGLLFDRLYVAAAGFVSLVVFAWVQGYRGRRGT